MAKRIKRLPLAPIIGAMFAVVGGVLVAAVPDWRFESIVVASGLPDLSPLAAPPLGMKARALAMIVAAIVLGGGVWIAVALAERMLGTRPARKTAAGAGDAAFDLGPYAEPVVPARRPIFADRELGAPFMSEEVLARAEPVPVAAPPESLSTPEPLAEPLAVEEFDLSDTPEPFEPLPGESTLDTLVRRLEAGIARRRTPQPPTPLPPATASVQPIRPPRDEPGSDADADDLRRALNTLRRMAG